MKTCGNLGTLGNFGWEHGPPPPPPGGPPNYPKEIEKECVAKSPSVYIYIVIQTS